MPVLDETLPSKKVPRNPLESLPPESPEDQQLQQNAVESLPKNSQEDSSSAARTNDSSKADSYQWHRTPCFWNSLSKVYLTPGSLREFDRRTARVEQLVLTPHSSANPPSGLGTKSVERFSRHGGPNLTHLRGFAIRPRQKNTMREIGPSRKRLCPLDGGDGDGSNLTTKCKSPYDANFEQAMIDRGIYPYNEGSAPKNFQDITDRMAKPRDSLSSSSFGDNDFNTFRALCGKVKDEASTRAEIIPIIAGQGRNRYHYASERLFNHLEPLSKDLPQAKPDLYDGALPQQIDPRVRRGLGKQIVPCNNTSLPAAPNFFLEVKSVDGRGGVAKRQVCYTGAVGTRAMHSLWNYNSTETMYDDNACSYSATYQDGHLRMYSHHLTLPKVPGGPPEYHMTQLRGFAMTDDIDSFRAGAAAFRNLRELAETIRDNCINHANQIARLAPASARSTKLTDSRTPPWMLQEDKPNTRPAKRTRHA